MKLIIYITAILTGLATIFLWTCMDVLTPAFDVDLYKANADGLYNSFYLKIGWLFILYFAIVMVFIFRDLYAKFTQRTRTLILVIYGFLMILVVFRTMSSAFELKNALNANQNEVVFTMLNAYSTGIYFNFFTFVGFLVFLSLIALFLPYRNTRETHY